MLRADQRGGNFIDYHPIQDMTRHLHWPIYSISTHVSISIFILLIKQLFSKIQSPKYHARASKEIRSRRTYKSLVNIQTSLIKEWTAFPRGTRRIHLLHNTGEGINPFGKFCRRITFELCFDRKEQREKR